MGKLCLQRIAFSLLWALLAGCTAGQPAASVAAATPEPTPLASPTPDPSAARVEGRYEITHTITETENHTWFVGDVEFRIFEVTPSCPSGPCDLSISSYNPDADSTADVVFTYADGVYALTSEPRTDQSQCTPDGVNYIDATYEFQQVAEFRVVEATDSGAGLVATRLEGTRTLTDIPDAAASAAGCLTARRVSTFVGVPTERPLEPTVLPADASCDQEAGTVSVASGAQSQMTINNHTGMVLTLYWLDFTGQRVENSTLGSHSAIGGIPIDTGYWFVLADPKERCLRLFHPPADISVTY